ncbi:MAG: pitrilysin family protein [Defluviicoccus sp.]
MTANTSHGAPAGFRIRWALILAFTLLLPLGRLAAAHAAVFSPETFTLANGLQVVVIQNRRAPVVTHMVWYKVGAADEPAGQSGLAHVLEHLMFKGTPTVPDGVFSQQVARNGGEDNAFTSHDYTAYFQNIANDRLGLVMELEADRMRNLTLSDAQVAGEINVVLEERHQRVDNNPAALLGERTNAVLFLNSPYRRPVIGWEHEVRGLTRPQILAFYRRWYHPGNAIVVVAGDVSIDEVRPLAERIYGAIPAAAAAERPLVEEPPPLAARRVSLDDRRVTQPAWSRHYSAPSARSGDGREAAALEVLAAVLGDGATSRLYRSLVVDGGPAVSAGAMYDPTLRGPSRFTISASPRQGVPLSAIETAVETVVRTARDGDLAAEDVERAKKRLMAEAVYARDSLSHGAHALGEALSIGLPITYVEEWPQAIAAVSRDDVIAAARSVLDDAHAVTALLPAAGRENGEGGQTARTAGEAQ